MKRQTVKNSDRALLITVLILLIVPFLILFPIDAPAYHELLLDRNGFQRDFVEVKLTNCAVLKIKAREETNTFVVGARTLFGDTNFGPSRYCEVKIDKPCTLKMCVAAAGHQKQLLELWCANGCNNATPIRVLFMRAY
jgi:hypothetical protein